MAESLVAVIVGQIQEYRPEMLLGIDIEALDVEDAKALLAEALTQPPSLPMPTAPGMPDIDLDGLVQDLGLTYQDHVRREQRQPDRSMRYVWSQTERAMTGADVLSCREDVRGRGLVLVTADGRKLLVTPGHQVIDLLLE